MPSGTSRVVSTLPATTSLTSHSRRKDESLRPRPSLNIGTTTVSVPATGADVITLQRVTCSPGEGEVLEPSARDRVKHGQFPDGRAARHSGHALAALARPPELRA